MDAHDSSNPNVPGSSGGGSFQQPDWPGGQAPRAGRRSILGRLAAQWWRILSIWVLLSAPVAYLIYSFVEPTYEAVSLLEVVPTTTELYGPGLRSTLDPAADQRYVSTQLKLLESNSVLDAALANPAISNLPMIRSSTDPVAGLRERLRVEFIGDSGYLIGVSLESRDPAEAAAIVNAVVKAYIEQHNQYHQKNNRSLRGS